MEDRRHVILLLYIDDVLLIEEAELITNERSRLATDFEMKDLGMMHYFLGMEVWQSTDGILLGQGKYAIDILKRFGMHDYKAISTPVESNLNLMCDDSSE